MRTYDSPYVVDWFVISLRWFAILGLAASMAREGQLVEPVSLFLLGLAAWNIFLAFVAATNHRLQYHRQISVGVDLVLSGIIFWMKGGLAGPTFWAGLIPILTSSLHFELPGSLSVSLVMALLMLVASAVKNFSSTGLWYTTLASGLTLLAGLVFGFLGRGAITSLRLIRQKNQDAIQRQLKFENDRLKALYELTSRLTVSLNYQGVLDAVLDLSQSILEPETDTSQGRSLVSVVLLFSENRLSIASARGLTVAELKQDLPAHEGALAKAVEAGEPMLVEDVPADPEISSLITLSKCKQVYIIPLRSGLNVYGLLLFGHPLNGYFTRERIDTLVILGRQAVIAIQNARLYQSLADERDRIGEVHEESRRKLARDLHDGPTQSISAIAMRINLARLLLDKDMDRVKEELSKAEELARNTVKEIRHMLFILRPLVLESQGLQAALQTNAEKLKEAFGQDVILDLNEEIMVEIDEGKQNLIFSIVEEALNNSRKHAQASHNWVKLNSVEDGIALLEIQDDGIGFNVNEVNESYDERGSLGMVNLHDRTNLLNGYLNILSNPGKGTRIQVYFPLTDEAATRMQNAMGKPQPHA